MNVTEVIEEARKRYELKGTLEVKGVVRAGIGGHWVEARIFIPDSTLGDPDCRFCQGMPGYPCERHGGRK